jgi:WD40 repeat protein
MTASRFMVLFLIWTTALTARAAEKLPTPEGEIPEDWICHWSPDGTRFITTGDAELKELWERKPLRRVAKFDAKSSSYSYSVPAFSSDSRRLAMLIGSEVCVVDASRGERLASCGEISHSGMLSLSIIANDRVLAIRGYDEIVLWGMEQRQVIQRLSLRLPSGRIGGAVSSDARTLVTAFEDGAVQLWNVEQRKLDATLLPHSPGTERIPLDLYSGTYSARANLGFSPDGAVLWMRSGEGEFSICNTAKRQTWSIPLDRECRRNMGEPVFSPRGDLCLLSAVIDEESDTDTDDDSTPKRKTVNEEVLIQLIDTATGQTRPVWRISGTRLRDERRSLGFHFSPDAAQLLGGAIDDWLYVWDTASGRILRAFWSDSALGDVDFLNNGTKLAVTEYRDQKRKHFAVRLYDASQFWVE